MFHFMSVSDFLIPVMKTSKAYRYGSHECTLESQFDWVSGREVLQRVGPPELWSETLLLQYLRIGNSGSTDPARPGFKRLLKRVGVKFTSRKFPPVVSSFTQMLPGNCISFLNE